MSPVAVYISLIILLVLALTVIGLVATGFGSLRNLRHDFDDLASVISVIHDSRRLKLWVKEHPEPAEWTGRGAEGMPKVTLGAFSGSEGAERWGVEIVGHEGVEQTF